MSRRRRRSVYREGTGRAAYGLTMLPADEDARQAALAALAASWDGSEPDPARTGGMIRVRMGGDDGGTPEHPESPDD